MDDIPVDDDIPLEMEGEVLEETVGGDDPAEDFVPEARTVGPGDGAAQLHKPADLETDAAFASLLGGDAPAIGPEADAGAIPEPVPHSIPDEEPLPPPEEAAPRMLMSDADMQSVPTPVHDGHQDDFESQSSVGDNFEP